MVVKTLLLMTGVPLLTASVKGSPVPVLKVQLCLVAFWSSKSKISNRPCPPSRVTVALAGNDRTLK